MCEKYQKGTEYSIGNSYSLAFDKGSLADDDYIILVNNAAIKDLLLFQCLYSSPNIMCYQCALNFIRHFCSSGFVSFNNPNRIDVCVNKVDDVINYVNQTLLPDELKLYLCIIIFRCDIDNNIYKSPNANGGVRHFVQILMLFGYKFNISQWQMPIIHNFIGEKNIQNSQYVADYPQLISDIGYKDDDWRKVNKDISFASVQDFTNMYQRILPQLSRL